MNKNNPSMYQCYERAEADEPVFTLLGRDPTAAVLVRMWTVLRRFCESPTDPEQLNEARAIADAMEKWCVDKWKRPLRLGEATRAIINFVIP